VLTVNKIMRATFLNLSFLRRQESALDDVKKNNE